MFMNLAVVLIVLLVAYWWAGQGFFSSVLHMASVIVAGAVAFAAWDPIVLLLGPKLNPPIVDMISGIALIGTFALTLALLRPVTTTACPANVDFSVTANTVGGGIAGLVSGIITAGIILIGIQFVQGPSVLLRYRGWVVNQSGAIVQADKLWVRADEMTDWFYSRASLGPMAMPEPLAKWQPQLAQQASLVRKSASEGKSRQGLKPGAVTIEKVQRVQLDNPATYIQQLPGIDRNTQLRSGQGDVYVIAVALDGTSKDPGTQVRVTKAQIRLIVHTVDDQWVPIHPHAFIELYQPESPDVGRWEFDSVSDELAAVSIGAGEPVRFGFEFLVPAQATLSHMLVKNSRTIVPATSTEYLREADLARLNLPTEILPPQVGDLDKPDHWQGFLVSGLLTFTCLFLSLLPAKRSHQD